MIFFLETPEGSTELEGELSVEDIAIEGMTVLLNGQEWARLWVAGQREWLNQWTVMERNESGCPQWIACREFDGTMTMIDNRRRE